MTRPGRADVHIHTLASDGTASVAEILAAAEARADLDIIGIADHERIDAALAARSMAEDAGLRIAVVVGEEITTRGGHLLALFLERPVKPLRSLRDSIAEVHDQGGLAIPAHPLAPYPLCAQSWVLRGLLDASDERVRPDAIETLNPTAFGRYFHPRVVRFADAYGLPHIGSSDAHAVAHLAAAVTTFPGRTVEDYRRALAERTTEHEGAFHGLGQVGTFGQQLRKYGRDARDELRGRIRRDGTGRDLGYPGGRLRPPRYEPEAARR